MPAVCIRRKRDCAFRHRRLYEFLPFFAVPAALPGAYCGYYSPNGDPAMRQDDIDADDTFSDLLNGVALATLFLIALVGGWYFS
ncbi:MULTISPECIES: hypothetical protein [Serratia]|uniref:Uncharacterized protein n=1 Tax=Serratia surfactantfaciens TaxID=2741499 RepID=A0ABS0LX00_9GAMM|nr:MULTISPECIES: hypothetical protein [Serratia]MBH1919855.1 hypothetical protein [Serratia surfactantfaciens]MTD09800.1 hypothetical protein [Serratia sp. YC16]WMW63395.1 hypothetical protein RE680_10195 [Serratia marcescens]